MLAKQLKWERNYGYLGGSQVSIDDAMSQIPSEYFRTPDTIETPYSVTMTDIVMPNFKELLRSGELLPTNPMSRGFNQPPAYGFCQYLYSREAPNGFFAGVNSGFGVAPSTAPVQLFTKDEVNGSKIRAVASCRSQGMDMLTTLAELHKTVAMVAGLRNTLERVFSDIARAARKYNKRPFRSMAEFWDVFSSLWLEGRFGWRILVYDLKSLYEHLSETEESKLIVGRDKMETERQTTSKSKQGDFEVVISTSYRDEVRTGYPGLVDLTVPGFASSLNTAWDIIPFSLVLDWFFDVQATILAHSGKPVNVNEAPGSSFLSRTLSVITTVEVHPLLDPMWSTTTVTSIPGVTLSEVKTRETMGDYSLNVALNPDLSNYRWLDLATLLKPLYKTIFR